jgi:hypothetical protein
MSTGIIAIDRDKRGVYLGWISQQGVNSSKGNIEETHHK